MEVTTVITKTIIGKANDLAREHEQLDMHIAVGRQMLYDLLGRMYNLALELDASVCLLYTSPSPRD